uniref:Uncharacterized protein n=1 Tax=Romanomermis culicivorax TaxID=13658 RepID=A0A915KDQ2_ROMCU
MAMAHEEVEFLKIDWTGVFPNKEGVQRQTFQEYICTFDEPGFVMRIGTFEEMGCSRNSDTTIS